MRHLRGIPVSVTFALFLVLCLPHPGDAAGRLRGSGGGWAVPLKAQHVSAVVTDGLARTTVRQVFVSNMNRTIEAIYEFPVPEGAALIDVAMEVGGRRYEGLLLDRGRARRIYDRLVRRRIDPALVEELDENIFRLSVFPVLPRKETIVELTWVEAVPRVDGVVRYTYPLTMYDEDTAHVSKDFTVRVEFESSEPVLEVTSPTPGMKIETRGKHRARASLKQQGARLDRDVVVEVRMAKPTAPQLSLTTYRSETGERWFLAGISTPRFKPDEVPPMEVTFVIDRSASMRGSKLANATSLVEEILGKVHEASALNVLAFAEEVERLADQPMSGPEAKARVTAFLDGLEADGHTDLGAALEAALAQPPGPKRLSKTILLLTDGVPNRGEREASRLIRIVKQAARPELRLSVVPLGSDQDLSLLGRLAAAGGGELLVSPRGSHRKAWGHLPRLARIESHLVPPALTGLTIEADGVVLSDVHPLPSKDLLAGHQVFLTGKYEGEGTATVTVTGRSAGRTVTLYSEHDFPAEPGGAPLVPFLHARRKIEDLAAVRPRTMLIKQRIIRTSLAAGVVSPLTSFLVLLPEDRRRLTNLADETAMREALKKAWEQRKLAVPGGTFEMSELVFREPTTKPKTPPGAGSSGSTGMGAGVGGAGARVGRRRGPVRNIVPEFMDGRMMRRGDRELEEPYREAIDRGLRWLSRHQNRVGSWSADRFTRNCGASLCNGKGRPNATVLVTALSALAFLGDAPMSLWYRDTGWEALEWLARELGRHGAIGNPKDEGFLLAHAVATLAFAEMFAFSGSSDWEHRTKRALDFLSRCESRSFREKVRLASAHPQLSPDPWTALAAITGRATKIRNPSLLPRVLKRLPPESALLGFALLGKEPARNERMREQAGISRDVIQSRESPADRVLFACLALRQVQGEGWQECVAKVLEPLLATQSEEGDEAGSWAPAGVWGEEGGRVAMTAMSVLILQSHYRYKLLHPAPEEKPARPKRLR